MFKKQKILYEVKVKAVEDYLSGEISIQEIANQLQISRFSIEEWIRKYKAFGVNGLKSNIKNKYYPPDIKLQAVTDYINKKVHYMKFAYVIKYQVIHFSKIG